MLTWLAGLLTHLLINEQSLFQHADDERTQNLPQRSPLNQTLPLQKP